MLTADELLAGAELTYEFELPRELAPPGEGEETAEDGADPGTAPGEEARVRLRPLTVQDLQVISRAARDSDALTATLMVQRALVDPGMSLAQVGGMPVGLLHFLLERVNRISGLQATSREIADAGREPIARAAHLLAREFGWAPEQVNQLTLGQVLLHLGMIGEEG